MLGCPYVGCQSTDEVSRVAAKCRVLELHWGEDGSAEEGVAAATGL